MKKISEEDLGGLFMAIDLNVPVERAEEKADRYEDCHCEELLKIIRHEVEEGGGDTCPKCKYDDIDFKKYCQPCKFELKEAQDE